MLVFPSALPRLPPAAPAFIAGVLFAPVVRDSDAGGRRSRRERAAGAGVGRGRGAGPRCERPGSPRGTGSLRRNARASASVRGANGAVRGTTAAAIARRRERRAGLLRGGEPTRPQSVNARLPPQRLCEGCGTSQPRGRRRPRVAHFARSSGARRSCDFPQRGFFVDLGEAMANHGALVAPGARTGERYGTSPLTAVQLARARGVWPC